MRDPCLKFCSCACQVGKSSGFEFFFYGGSYSIIIMIFETSNAGFLNFAMLAVAVPVVEARESRAGELRWWRIWGAVFLPSSVAKGFGALRTTQLNSWQATVARQESDHCATTAIAFRDPWARDQAPKYGHRINNDCEPDSGWYTPSTKLKGHQGVVCVVAALKTNFQEDYPTLEHLPGIYQVLRDG